MSYSPLSNPEKDISPQINKVTGFIETLLIFLLFCFSIDMKFREYFYLDWYLIGPVFLASAIIISSFFSFLEGRKPFYVDKMMKSLKEESTIFELRLVFYIVFPIVGVVLTPVFMGKYLDFSLIKSLVIFYIGFIVPIVSFINFVNNPKTRKGHVIGYISLCVLIFLLQYVSFKDKNIFGIMGFSPVLYSWGMPIIYSLRRQSKTEQNKITLHAQ